MIQKDLKIDIANYVAYATHATPRSAPGKINVMNFFVFGEL